MSFMTGRMPSKNKIWTNYGQLSSEIPCWTHYLSLAGYETALIGRMHFEGPDQWHGFQKRAVGEIAQPESWGIKKRGNGQQRMAPLVAGKGTSPYQWYDATNKVSPVLFNQKEDPEEINNLANDPEYKTKINGMMKKLLDNWNPEMIASEIPQESLVSSRAHAIFAEKNLELGEDWRKTISAWWNSHNISFKEWAEMKRPAFPPELDSPYQPPTGK
jgi:arylsulfatase A-like enzyme